MTTNNERNLVIIFGSIFLALLLLFLILLKSYEKELSTNASNVALQNNDSVKTNHNSSEIVVFCKNNLEFMIFANHNLIQVFEPTENNSQSIPKRCNQWKHY